MISEVEDAVRNVCARKLGEWLERTPEDAKAEELEKWLASLPEPVRRKYPRDTGVMLFLAHKYLEFSGGSSN